MKRLTYILILFAFSLIHAQAQSDRQYIREGNRLYRSGKYTQAETSYRKAIDKNRGNHIAVYNLGCALMRQHNDSAAIEQFSNAAVMTTDKAKRALSYHNIGVLYQQKKKYKEAISAYQDALRNNPKDNDTRYNFVLCKRLLKQQQQQQQQQQNKNNSDNQQNQDKQDQKQQDQDKNKNQQNNDKQQQQQPKEQMSKENAEQLLNAAMQEEKATQERLKKAMQQPQRRKLDKNW